MKKIIYCIVLAVVVLLTSCGPKPYYKTSEGKKKQKHYNAIQFGDHR
jgi:hypothetical protein